MLIIITIIIIIILVFSYDTKIMGGNNNRLNEIGTIKNIKLLDRKVKNLVSVSWYTLPNAYRPLSEYSDGLLKLLKIVEDNDFNHDIILNLL